MVGRSLRVLRCCLMLPCARGSPCCRLSMPRRTPETTFCPTRFSQRCNNGLGVGLYAGSGLPPPCTSFTVLQNGHKDGPWRSRGVPMGFGRPEVVEGNEIWRRTMVLVKLCMECGVFWAVENPLSSYAWRHDDTAAVLAHEAVRVLRLDMCEFPDGPEVHPLRHALHRQRRSE